MSAFWLQPVLKNASASTVCIRERLVRTGWVGARPGRRSGGARSTNCLA